MPETTDHPREAVEETPQSSQDSALAIEDLLVEDVSIDGMCGVY